MRVLVRLRARGPERGVTAVVVGLMSTVIFGIAVFSVDFGMSYANTRQLQTASDAAALAAAAKYADIPGTCAQMMATATATGRDAQAVTAGDTLREQNRSGATRIGYSVTCAGGRLNVTYSSQGATPSFFGGIFGRNAGYTTDRPATASVAVAPQAKGRPYALCSGQLGSAMTGSLVKIQLPDPSDTAGTTACPTAEIGGNWWTVRCPDQTNSGSLGEDTLEGCDEPIKVTPGQPTSPTPTTLGPALAAACPSITSVNKNYCLETDTGQVRGTPIITVWDQFVINQETIIVPVFCGEPSCTPAGLSNPSGNGNLIYPVYKLAAIKICGYHWGPETRDNLTGDCSTNPNGYRATDGDSNDNFLLVVPTAIRTSGGTAEFACDLGADCDGGARRVLLTK